MKEVNLEVINISSGVWRREERWRYRRGAHSRSSSMKFLTKVPLMAIDCECWRGGLFSSAWTATTKYHRLGGL